MADLRIKIEWVEGATTTFKKATRVTLVERGGKKMGNMTYVDNVVPGDKVKFLPRHDFLTVSSITEIDLEG